MEIKARTSHKGLEKRIVAWREAYQTKKGLKYRIRWREDGKRKNKKAGFYKSTARNLIQDVEDKLVLNKPTESVKVKDCCNRYLKTISESVKPRTAEIARTSLVPFVNRFENRSLQEIQTHEIENFKNELLSVRKSNGINIVIRNVKTFLEWSVRNGYLLKNPGKDVGQFKVKPVARFLNRKEMTKIYQASSKSLRRAIFVLYNTGMRQGEFLGISRKDVIGSEVQVDGKTGKRRVPLRPSVKRILVKVAGTWNKNKFRSAWVRMTNKAKMGRVRPHDLRHTFASAYLKNGGTPLDLGAVGGWTNLSTLKIYSHFEKNYLAERMMRVRL